MTVVATIKELLAEVEPTGSGEADATAFWCDDCRERVLVDRNLSDPPACSDCGDEMRPERTPDSGDCAC